LWDVKQVLRKKSTDVSVMLHYVLHYQERRMFIKFLWFFYSSLSVQYSNVTKQATVLNTVKLSEYSSKS
jgi:hypothetical protein